MNYTVEIWNAVPLRQNFWRIQWTRDLSPATPYLYFTDGSKQQDGTVGCAFLVVSEGNVLGESMFRLSDGATVFAAEVHAIKEAVTDALTRGLGDFDVYSDSRSALEALNSLVPRHRAVVEIKDLVKQIGEKITARRITAHIGHVGQETNGQTSWQKLPLNAFRLMW